MDAKKSLPFKGLSLLFFSSLLMLLSSSILSRLEGERMTRIMAELTHLGSIDDVAMSSATHGDRLKMTVVRRPAIAAFVLDQMHTDEKECPLDTADSDLLFDAETHLAALDDQLISISADLQAISDTFHSLDHTLVQHLQDDELQQQPQQPFDDWMRDADSDLDALLLANSALDDESHRTLHSAFDDDDDGNDDNDDFSQWLSSSSCVAPRLLHDSKTENNLRTLNLDHAYAKVENDEKDNDDNKDESIEPEALASSSSSSLSVVKEEPSDEGDKEASLLPVKKEEDTNYESSVVKSEASALNETAEASALVDRFKDEPLDDHLFDPLNNPVSMLSPSSSSSSSTSYAEPRDVRKAKELNLPFSVDELVNAPVDSFNDMLERHELTDTQLALCRDIRRRGKNKVAAQNCRKRKLDQIRSLEEDVAAMHQRKHQLMLEHEKLLMERTQWSGLVKQMHDFVLDNLGHDPAQWQLQRVGRGDHVRVAPRGTNDNGLDDDRLRRSNDRRHRDKRSK